MTSSDPATRAPVCIIIMLQFILADVCKHSYLSVCAAAKLLRCVWNIRSVSEKTHLSFALDCPAHSAHKLRNNPIHKMCSSTLWLRRHRTRLQHYNRSYKFTNAKNVPQAPFAWFWFAFYRFAQRAFDATPLYSFASVDARSLLLW